MNQTLKNIVNHSLSHLSKPKIVNSITQLCQDAVNKSFQFQSQSDNSLDNSELLKMQIKQLKRENLFLKGKIQQMKKGKHQFKPQLNKKQSLNCINILKKNALDLKNPSHQNPLSFILKQVQSILKSLTTIYKVQVENKTWFLQQGNIHQKLENCEQKTDWLKIDKQFKEKINKKLQMISLQKQQTRYCSLLQVFLEFYKAKMQDERKIKNKIQKSIQKTIQIGKKLIENVSQKALQKSIIKSSCIYSIKAPIDENQAHNISNIEQNYFMPQNSRLNNFQKHELSYSTIDGHNNCNNYGRQFLD